MQKNDKTEYEKLLARAAKICSSAEKCTADIRQKLITWGLNEAQIEKALNYLEKNQFIDDKRYAKFFVKDKFHINRWGKIKITYALRQKQIGDQVIEQALQIIGDNEYRELLDDMLKKKIKSTGNISDYSVKAKMIRFAAQRGFSQEEIYESLSRIERK